MLFPEKVFLCKNATLPYYIHGESARHEKVAPSCNIFIINKMTAYILVYISCMTRVQCPTLSKCLGICLTMLTITPLNSYPHLDAGKHAPLNCNSTIYINQIYPRPLCLRVNELRAKNLGRDKCLFVFCL